MEGAAASFLAQGGSSSLPALAQEGVGSSSVLGFLSSVLGDPEAPSDWDLTFTTRGLLLKPAVRKVGSLEEMVVAVEVGRLLRLHVTREGSRAR